MRILGIDPGSRATGYGIIEDSPSFKLISYGAIRPPGGMPLPERLKFIYQGLQEEIKRHTPSEAAIEGIFFAKNVRSALILGQARGVAILSAANSNLSLAEYSPTEIKQAIVGFGRADKSQVGSMVGFLLKVKGPLRPLDASDALAVAICHSHSNTLLRKVLSQ